MYNFNLTLNYLSMDDTQYRQELLAVFGLKHYGPELVKAIEDLYDVAAILHIVGDRGEPAIEVRAERDVLDADSVDHVLDVVEDAITRGKHLPCQKERPEDDADDASCGGDGVDLLVSDISRMIVEGAASRVRAEDRLLGDGAGVEHARRVHVRQIDAHVVAFELDDELLTKRG